MDIREIVTVAQGLSEREFQETELEALTVMCEESVRRWQARLREDVVWEEHKGVFILACAWSALAVWEEVSQAALPRAFTAGALRVERGGDSSAGARSLERQAEVLMTPYVEDGAFAFLEVMG